VKKTSPDWRVGLYFYSLILNSTLIWRVVIRTPSLLFSCLAIAEMVSITPQSPSLYFTILHVLCGCVLPLILSPCVIVSQIFYNGLAYSVCCRYGSGQHVIWVWRDSTHRPLSRLHTTVTVSNNFLFKFVEIISKFY
jgi:hypothetical protein